MKIDRLWILALVTLSAGAAQPAVGQLKLICGADSNQVSTNCRQFDEASCTKPQSTRADGCSIPDAVPSGEREWAKRSFKKACDEHDICYGSRGADKGKCDGYFKKNLDATCQWMKDSQHPDEIPQCGAFAGIMYLAVESDPTGDAEFGFASGQKYFWSSCSGCDPSQESYVRLLKDRTFSGDSRVISYPEKVKNLRDVDFTDEASSAFFCLEQGVSVKLWEDDTYRGRKIEVTGAGKPTTMNLEKKNFGDEISSVSWN